jgi:hypothetical protein
MSNERPPRLRLIRVFLSMLVGFMAGLVGWMFAMMAVVLGQGPALSGRLPSLPLALQVFAFFGPAIVAGYWLFMALGSSRG